MSNEHTTETDEPEAREGRRVISNATPIQIGIVLTLLGGFAAWIWWAATISSKLDVLVGKQVAIENNIAAIRTDVENLKVWRGVVDTSGSASVQRLKDELLSVERKLDLHIEADKASRGKGP